MKLNQILCAALCVMATAVQAATVVELSGQGKVRQIVTDGKKARISAGNNDYVIVDYKSSSVKMVMNAKQQVLVMDGEMPSVAGKAPEVKTSLKKNGNGPDIAGYGTTAYDWGTNMKKCGRIYASKEVLAVDGMRELFDAMHTLMKKQRDAMGGYAAMMDGCTRANLQMTDQVEKIGIPMRIVKADGQVVNEIKSIKTNVTVPKNAFDIPADYKVVTMQEMMQRAQQARQSMQQQMPQIQQQLQQLKASGKLSPEAMKQLEKYQQMMQQGQQ